MKLILLSALLLAPALKAQNSGTLQGSVVDSSTCTGISGVAVYFGSDQGVTYETLTDSAGSDRRNSDTRSIFGFARCQLRESFAHRGHRGI